MWFQRCVECSGNGSIVRALLWPALSFSKFPVVQEELLPRVVAHFPYAYRFLSLKLMLYLNASSYQGFILRMVLDMWGEIVWPGQLLCRDRRDLAQDQRYQSRR